MTYTFASEPDSFFGGVPRAFLFIQKNNNPTKTLNTLKEFKNLAQETSETFNYNMHEKYQELCDQYEEEILFLNLRLIKILLKICERENIEVECAENIFKFNIDSKTEVDDVINQYKINRH